ncbi:MAG TPA: M14 family metallopeptidase [Pyrinomonadaceae bacterium]|jgi:hypothetical protein
MPTRTFARALALAALLALNSFAQTHPARLFNQTQTAHDGAVGTATNLASAMTTQASVPAPEDVIGFRPGDDRRLASWQSIVEYFRRLDAASDRVQFEELGRTTLDAPFVLATISAPENLRRLKEFREIQRRLADPRTLGANPDRRAAELIARGKTVVLITCGIHSTEVGSTLSSMLVAHRLASSNEREVSEILNNTIVLLVPSLNPDGVDIVKKWYDRTLGTPYEGTSPPTLYHHYTGHDNNRDWYAFTQRETQLTVDKIHNLWHPQIVHDIHQQGALGARLFLPPYMQPVEPNVSPKIVEGYTELGSFMAREMTTAGFRGITTNSTYDAWTPARAYSHYHGGVRILSETASARIALPITVRFEDLRPDEGYDPRRVSDTFFSIWPGGEWRLRDITNYMTTAAFTLMRHAAQNRERWLRRFYEVGREAVRPRRPGELFAWIIPPTENAGTLLATLERGGVETIPIDKVSIDGIAYPAGSNVIPMNQPYGGFAKALLEAQRYPDLRDASGHPISPYDVTAHTLSLLMGVEAKPIYKPFRYREKLVGGKARNSGCGGNRPPRRALYKSHVAAMDEGWTRWVLEQAGSCFEHLPLEDAEIRRGDLRAKFDVIVIPDQSARNILEGHRRGTMPEELTGGIGNEGVAALRRFVEDGGTLICLNRASNFAIEQLSLPVRDAAVGLKRTEFYVPGSILRIELDTTNFIAATMPKQSIAWVEDSPVFEIVGGGEAARRVRVVARYPEHGDPLLSGWLLGGARLRGKAALVEVALGAGRVYLFGFRPQYRAQSLATYPLLLRAITHAENVAP